MIVATNVTKKYGKVKAVDDVSFDLSTGKALALWGSNGAGKTTLIRCVLGIVRSRGKISIGSIDVRKRGRDARNLVGYVPQELAFHDDVRMWSAMLFFAGLRKTGAKEAAASLEQVGLAGHERKRLRDLSGGMKQRLALAIALLSDPPIIILDEPTSNLDAAGRGEVTQTLRDLKAAGKTLLFASHHPDEVIALADNILVMQAGRVEKTTTPEELWPTRIGVQIVRLYLSLATEEAAASVLRKAGHAVNLNGHGLCVAVSRDQKAAPIHTLAQHDIEVRDLEFLDDAQYREIMP
ncbi:ABC transporter ATP-binding protein [Phycisphaeraceae bacterium AH-315-B13]|nr:ABC transporter ATP-binding protein [Phycisphaeraceae bacterium AH-315-B13]